MNKLHRWALTALLLFLGFSLLIPGIIEILRIEQSAADIAGISQTSQLRALNAMMAGLGLLACLAGIRLEQARIAVVGIGITLSLVVLARVYSLLIDGMPDTMSLFYLVVEALLALVFLSLPPPADH